MVPMAPCRLCWHSYIYRCQLLMWLPPPCCSLNPSTALPVQPVCSLLAGWHSGYSTGWLPGDELFSCSNRPEPATLGETQMANDIKDLEPVPPEPEKVST